jgi:hypothetical protein
MGLSATYDLRTELARMNDVADFIDTFDDVLSYTPGISASGSMGTSLTTVNRANYWLLGGGRHVLLDLSLIITTSGSASNQIIIQSPTSSYGSLQPFACFLSSTTIGNSNGNAYLGSGTNLAVERRDGTNYPIEAITVAIKGIYTRS